MVIHDAFGEGAKEYPVHRAGQLSVLACPRAQRNQIIHLRASARLSEGKSLHH